MVATLFWEVLLLPQEHIICIDTSTYVALIGWLFVLKFETALNEKNMPV